jgi:hypothetical protein
MYPALNSGLAATLQMQVEVVNKFLRYFDERNIPGDAAIVPPIRLQRRYPVRQAGVVDRHHYKIHAVFEGACHLVVKWCKSALVLAGLLPVHPYL